MRGTSQIKTNRRVLSGKEGGLAPALRLVTSIMKNPRQWDRLAL